MGYVPRVEGGKSRLRSRTPDSRHRHRGVRGGTSEKVARGKGGLEETGRGEDDRRKEERGAGGGCGGEVTGSGEGRGCGRRDWGGVTGLCGETGFRCWCRGIRILKAKFFSPLRDSDWCKFGSPLR